MNYFKLFSQIVTSEIASSENIASSSEETSSNNTSNFSWDNVFSTVAHWIQTTGLRILIGIIVLFIGFKIINAISRSIKRKMELKKCDKTVTSLTFSFFRIGFKVLLVLLFISFIGIDTAAVGSILSAIGIGLSLAVQGSLSNFAGGIVIIIMKPFGIGDYITAQGVSGTVEKIQLFYTYIVAPDNRVHMVPNGELANSVITNNSMKKTRRVDLTFTISYDSSVDKAIAIIKETELKNNLIFHTPEPFVGISEFADSSINLITKVWVKNEDYWTTIYELNDSISKAFVANNIVIPYPQLDVHLTK